MKLRLIEQLEPSDTLSSDTVRAGREKPAGGHWPEAYAAARGIANS